LAILLFLPTMSAGSLSAQTTLPAPQSPQFAQPRPAANRPLQAVYQQPAAAPTPTELPPPNRAFAPADIFPPGTEVLPIDLPTALRVADGSNPTVALARLRVQEAYAHLTQAQVAWLPNLQAGTTYYRHDGNLQNAAGNVFGVSKSTIFAGGGAVADFKTSDALFLPVIARRLAQAQDAASRSVAHDIQLDVAIAYFDLLQAHAQYAVNADLLARDQDILMRAEAAEKAGLQKTGADINRARTEYQLRLQERIAQAGQVRIASSRLARLLLLKPTVGLLPTDMTVVPLTLISEDANLDGLVAIALSDRPELTEGRELISASEARLRQAHLDPLLPHFQVSYLAGGFGGGIDSNIENYKGRGDGTATAYWELQNLGLGYRAENRTRRIQVDEASTHLLEVQAQVSDEVVRAAQTILARRQALAPAQEAVVQALEMFHKLDVIAFGMNGPKRELDSVEPLLAIQQLAQARYQYLAAVLDYNRAQFRLYTAIGQPALGSGDRIRPETLAVPVLPAAVRKGP
jgi:outer membrane protein TolC